MSRIFWRRIQEMGRSKVIEGVMKMRFEDINERYRARSLRAEEAADLLGVSVRTFLRKRERYEEEGFDGGFDLRIGKKSWKRADENEVRRISRLYEKTYRGFSVKHFHEFAQRSHGLKYGYTWTKKVLEKEGLVKKGKRGGDHRLRRERRSMEGMMIHQDGSTHQWILALEYMIDLIITLDDATSTITSGFFVPQEGTQSSFGGIKETIEEYGLFCSFYTDRGSHYWYTPEGGGRVSKSQLTQVGRALKQLGIQHIAAYSPQARGRSERLFGTLQGRLPQELALHGIKTIEEANRYLKEVYIPRHNAQFSVKASAEEKAYIKWKRNDLDDILCLYEERQVQNDNSISYKGLRLQIPRDGLRHHYVKTTVEVHEYIDGFLSVFYGPRHLASYSPHGYLQQEREGGGGEKRCKVA
jgi:transposase